MTAKRTIVFILAFLETMAFFAGPSEAASRSFVQCGQPPVDPCGSKVCTIIADEIDIEVDRGGGVFWNGEALDQKKLADYAKSLAKDRNPLPVIVMARDDAPFGNFASVMRTLKENGVRHVACQARP